MNGASPNQTPLRLKWSQQTNDPALRIVPAGTWRHDALMTTWGTLNCPQVRE